MHRGRMPVPSTQGIIGLMPGHSPYELAAAFHQEEGFAFLDSSRNDADQGRYSILAWKPQAIGCSGLEPRAESSVTSAMTCFVSWNGSANSTPSTIWDCRNVGWGRMTASLYSITSPTSGAAGFPSSRPVRTPAESDRRNRT